MKDGIKIEIFLTKKDTTFRELLERLNKTLKLKNPDFYRNGRKITNMESIANQGDEVILVDVEHIIN